MAARAARMRRGLEQSFHLDLLPPAHPQEHFLLLVPAGIADPDLEHEAVELCLGERIGPLVLDRILGREDEEGLLEAVRGSADRDLMFLHGLEQGRLHLRRRAVDLVRQNDLREERALLDVEVLGLLVEDHGSDQIGGQQVRGELNPRERRADDLRERAHGERLGQARDSLEQDVATGQQPHEEALDHGILPHDASGDFLEDRLHGQRRGRLVGQLRQTHAIRLRWFGR